MTSRQLRLLRGAGVSSIATFLAAVSHTVGGGAAPHPLLVLALSVFLTPIAALLVGRTPKLRRVIVSVLVAQGVFHVLFQFLGATLGSGISSAGHHHELMTLGPVLAVPAPDAPMLAAHMIAAALTTALLWRGEQLLRGIARWMRAALRPRTLSVSSAWPTPVLLSNAAHSFVSVDVLAGVVTRRGPPLPVRG